MTLSKQSSLKVSCIPILQICLQIKSSIIYPNFIKNNSKKPKPKYLLTSTGINFNIQSFVEHYKNTLFQQSRTYKQDFKSQTIINLFLLTNMTVFHVEFTFPLNPLVIILFKYLTEQTITMVMISQ